MNSRVSVVDQQIRIYVRVSPGSSKDEIGAWRLDPQGRAELLLRVRARAEAGKANAAVVDLLSTALSIPKKSIRIARGETSRCKAVDITASNPHLAPRIKLLGSGA